MTIPNEIAAGHFNQTDASVAVGPIESGSYGLSALLDQAARAREKALRLAMRPESRDTDVTDYLAESDRLFDLTRAMARDGMLKQP